MKKRFFASLMALCLALSLIPGVALAQGSTTKDTSASGSSNRFSVTVIVGKDDEVEYNGKAQSPAVAVINDTTGELVKSSEYSLKFTNNKNVADASDDKAPTVTVKFSTKKYIIENADNDKGEVIHTFSIVPGEPELTVNPISMTYDGEAPEDKLIKGTAKVGGATIKGTWEFVDFDETDAGTYTDVTVRFTPKDEDNFYEAETTTTVRINPAKITVKKVVLEDALVAELKEDNVAYAKIVSFAGLKGDDLEREKEEAGTGLEMDVDFTIEFPTGYKKVASGKQKAKYIIYLENSNYTFAKNSSITSGTVVGTVLPF